MPSRSGESSSSSSLPGAKGVWWVSGSSSSSSSSFFFFDFLLALPLGLAARVFLVGSPFSDSSFDDDHLPGKTWEDWPYHEFEVIQSNHDQMICVQTKTQHWISWSPRSFDFVDKQPPTPSADPTGFRGVAVAAGIGEGGVVVGGRIGVRLEDAAGAPSRIAAKLNASEEESRDIRKNDTRTSQALSLEWFSSTRISANTMNDFQIYAVRWPEVWKPLVVGASLQLQTAHHHPYYPSFSFGLSWPKLYPTPWLSLDAWYLWVQIHINSFISLKLDEV